MSESPEENQNNQENQDNQDPKVQYKLMVKSWIETDDKINKLMTTLKELKDEKKQYENYIIDYMDDNKYVEVRVRVPNENKYGRDGVKYSDISNEIQTFVDYMKRKWKIVDVTYEYEELVPDENIGAYTKVRTKSTEPSLNTKLYDGKFNLTIKQLDKEPNMFQRFIKRF
jgi:hypothetical protein